MYQLWRHFVLIYHGEWIGLIDCIKDSLPDDYYLSQIDRDLTLAELRWLLTCTEWAAASEDE